MNCAQMKILEGPFCSLRTLSACPSLLEIGVPNSSVRVAPPSSYRLYCMDQRLLSALATVMACQRQRTTKAGSRCLRGGEETSPD